MDCLGYVLNLRWKLFGIFLSANYDNSYNKWCKNNSPRVLLFTEVTKLSSIFAKLFSYFW